MISISIAIALSLGQAQTGGQAASYTAEALKRREQGLAIASLLIDKNGRVSSCAIAQSTGSHSLDKATCELAKRVKGTPAKNDKGEPIEGTFTLRFRWVLPDVPRPGSGLSVDAPPPARVESSENH